MYRKMKIIKPLDLNSYIPREGFPNTQGRERSCLVILYLFSFLQVYIETMVYIEQ